MPGLKPWRDVIEPHDDVATGQYQPRPSSPPTSHQVRAEGRCRVRRPGRVLPPDVPDPRPADLLIQTIRRVSGAGGEPVVDLLTNFGGGKTHSLLAVYHLCGPGYAVEPAGMSRNCSPRQA